MNEEITGIILAGGKSSRMGFNKALAKIENQNMIDIIIETLKPICSEIIISTNSTELNYLPYNLISDEHLNIGPLGGIYSCIKQSKTTKNLVIACDTPRVKKETLTELIRASKSFDITFFSKSSKDEPLPSVFNKSILPYIETAISAKNYSLIKTYLLSNYQRLFYTNDLNEPEEFINVNTPNELQKVT